LLHALLFLAAWWLISDAPNADATNAEIADYYASTSSRRVLLVGLYLMPFAGIAFVWFIVALRMWEEGSSRRRSVLQSNLQLVAGILYVGLFFVASAASSVLAASVEFSDGDIDPVAARQFPVFGSNDGLRLRVPDGRDVRLHHIGDRAEGRHPATLVRLERLRGGAFLLLSASFERWFVLVFPLWLIVLSVLLLRSARKIDPELRLPRGRHEPLVVRQPPAQRVPGR
jgi:hypothetical protein